MRVAVDFGGERLDFEVPDDRVVDVRHGPEAAPAEVLGRLICEALEAPLEFPRLVNAFVPGDRVVLAIDLGAPGLAPVLETVVAILRAAGVEAESIQVLATGPGKDGSVGPVPDALAWTVHDPSDRDQIAYLASTSQDRRVYLNRALTDADVVIPIGRLGYDPVLGYRGPWSLIFPALSDSETQRAYRTLASDRPPDREREQTALTESAEVSWLLGSQFHIGLLAGVGGLARVVAGLDTAVRSAGTRAVDESWSYRVDERAEVVVAGIGGPDDPGGLDELASGLETASRLVRRGGKIVALSRVSGPLGPAMQRLVGSDLARPGLSALRGAEGEPDAPAARQLARALAWADIYLSSELGEDAVDDLGMIPLGRPEEARRLAAAADSCLFLSQAERTRAHATEDDEPDDDAE